MLGWCRVWAVVAGKWERGAVRLSALEGTGRQQVRNATRACSKTYGSLLEGDGLLLACGTGVARVSPWSSRSFGSLLLAVSPARLGTPPLAKTLRLPPKVPTARPERLTHGGNDGDEHVHAVVERLLDVLSNVALGDLDVVLGGSVDEHEVEEAVVDVDELVLGADNVGHIDVVGRGGELLVLAAGEDLVRANEQSKRA